eukprot:CAMPEP_0177657700 /NCGR_PEP_ID=MMETSP0447-20121125/16352_1 /TAXON_ID=0 /ORGANISM="Stygamoeba regulata, Strain BSH-02190019" /LENGTH=91 /DNA_ID=CAMNT_0019162127 /DNA_START=190 /DNA_END=465 /DNA_ORIENTATION=-
MLTKLDHFEAEMRDKMLHSYAAQEQGGDGTRTLDEIADKTLADMKKLNQGEQLLKDRISAAQRTLAAAQEKDRELASKIVKSERPLRTKMK